LLKFIFCFLFFIVYLLKPSIGLAFDTSDPSVSLLQNRISNNFSRKYCTAIQNGFSKDEAMKSAIVKTENIISFSYNPQKKWIEKDDLANQISLQVVNDCGWSFGLIGYQALMGALFIQASSQTTGQLITATSDIPITGLEILSVLSNTQVIAAHFFGLCFSLWLLRRIYK